MSVKKFKEDGFGFSGLVDNLEEGLSFVFFEVDFLDFDLNKDEFGELEGIRLNKKFKCKYCFKIFRLIVGFYRYINMYYNLEKFYVCDICYKRFYTNFKVWIYC